MKGLFPTQIWKHNKMYSTIKKNIKSTEIKFEFQKYCALKSCKCLEIFHKGNSLTGLAFNVEVKG